VVRRASVSIYKEKKEEMNEGRNGRKKWINKGGMEGRK
jgi:hypothetical protein